MGALLLTYRYTQCVTYKYTDIWCVAPKYTKCVAPETIFVITFTRPKFLGPKFTQKRVNWNNGKLATKQHECFKCVKVYTARIKFTQFV